VSDPHPLHLAIGFNLPVNCKPSSVEVCTLLNFTVFDIDWVPVGAVAFANICYYHYAPMTIEARCLGGRRLLAKCQQYYECTYAAVSVHDQTSHSACHSNGRPKYDSTARARR
jgi:hypothetical protein